MAIELIEQCVEGCAERRKAREVFYADLDPDVPTMNDHFRDASESAFLFWFAFDYQLDDGSYVVDRILAANPLLAAGERRYLDQMRATAMMPYEVMAVHPGESVVLRRLDAREEIEVREKTGSKTFQRWDMLVARVNPVGPSGGPEIEMGAVLIPPMVQEEIAKVFHEEREGRPDRDGPPFKALGAIFHQIWLKTIIAPQFPLPVTEEGDPVMFVTLRFDVLDEPCARSALNAEPALDGEGDRWRWIAGDSQLGTIHLAGSQLTLQTHSESRADRGRQLLERIARDAIAYRGCVRVDVYEQAQEALRSGKPSAPPRVEDEIPPEIKDQLFQEYMARHSQHWLDDHIPALDRQTPRFAAQSPAFRPRLVGLLKDMENQYLRRPRRRRARVRSHMDVGRAGAIRPPRRAAGTASAVVGA